MLNRHASISLRLTLWFGGIFLSGWVLFGAAMWVTLKTTLKSERRLTLERRIDRLEELLEKDSGESEGDRAQDFKDFAHATGNGLAEIRRSDGTRAYPSPSAVALNFPWPVVGPDTPEQLIHVDAADQPYWVFGRPFTLGEERLYLLAAAPEAGNLVVLASFRRGLLASVPILLLISSAGGYWLSRRALRPVDRITATARSISIRNISERLPVTATGDELQRLAETCNDMLGRLEASVNQIKQFTADASHELRGPLSFTRTIAEVALKNPQIDPESKRALEDIVKETASAAVLLDDMLTLARADAVSFSVPLEPINLSSLVADVCAMARPIALERSLSLDVSQPSSTVSVLGDAPSLRRLLWILLDNALKYTNPSGRIAVSLFTGADSATLLVSDSGIGIAPADLPYVFDRFYRADPSRGMVEGNGLGLAIAKWIADSHRVELSVTSEESKGTAFRMTFGTVIV
jgi:heavy metal sensor kinase